MIKITLSYCEGGSTKSAVILTDDDNIILNGGGYLDKYVGKRFDSLKFGQCVKVLKIEPISGDMF